MTKFSITFVCCCIIIVATLCFGVNEENQYLRIHIRANSNEVADQNIKYEIRDLVVKFFSTKLENVKNKDDVITIINNNESAVKGLIDRLLKEKGFNYTSKLSIRNEKFPTRVYEDLTLLEGFYDALIIELGSGKGDNWWCVIYPPLCFIGSEDIEYRSLIYDLLKNHGEK